MLGRGTTWFDMSTFENIFNTSEFVKIIQNRQGLSVGALNINVSNK